MPSTCTPTTVRPAAAYLSCRAVIASRFHAFGSALPTPRNQSSTTLPASLSGGDSAPTHRATPGSPGCGLPTTVPHLVSPLVMVPASTAATPGGTVSGTVLSASRSP